MLFPRDLYAINISFHSVGVSTVSARCATPAVYTQVNTDKHQTSSDAGRKQQSLLTENSGGTNLHCLLTVTHRTIFKQWVVLFISLFLPIFLDEKLRKYVEAGHQLVQPWLRFI